MRPYHDMVEKAKAYFISDLREERNGSDLLDHQYGYNFNAITWLAVIYIHLMEWQITHLPVLYPVV